MRRASRLLRVFPLALVIFLMSAVAGFSQNVSADAPYKNPHLPVEQRVHDLLERMTLQEKASMLSGAGWMESVSIPRLGIPSIKMADGPMGIRSWLGSSAITSKNMSARQFSSTAFPAGIMMAATWDPAMLELEGHTIGAEMNSIGRDMILGPTVNIQRTPLWGRNFEGYGEDPYLAGQLAVPYIKGVQSQGVIPSVKHFDANNEEFERHRIDEAIDERTLHEIYMPAFKAAVQQGGVWSVMSAYNKVNGTYCAENAYLLTDVLRKDWGFKGFVVSDWGSTYSTAPTVNAGMDLEMPGGERARTWLAKPETQKSGNGGDWLAPEKVLAALKAGEISETTLDRNVGRILYVIFASGQFDHPHTASAEIDTPEQRAVARHAADEGIVLLKNAGNLLPLNSSALKSIAVIGPNADVAVTGGGGSSLVHTSRAVTPLEGIKERAGSKVQVTYAQGAPIPVKTSGENAENQPAENSQELLQQATTAAAKADVAIVFVGSTPKVESESFDRTTLNLPPGEDELIESVARANPKTIVVFNSGSSVNISRWIAHVPALLDSFFGGEEGGHAIADVLFGDVNPSGKLPFSFINDFKESPAYGNYPGENLHVKYAEGIYVGYRYYDKHDIAPQFPFGFGLSYTSFAYTGLKITPAKAASGQQVQVTLQVRNTGKRAGAEVVQLYVHDVHPKVDRPVKELKGFRRVELSPGQSKTVSFTLDRSSFAYYSTPKHHWVVDPGKFEVMVGASSRDIRLKGGFEVTP